MRELLLEIGCEEMPASWLPSLTRQLETCLTAALDEARLAWSAPVQAFTTPRRLAVHVADVAGRQADVEETVTGPPVRAAFDDEGAPTKAAIGFAKKQGVAVDALQRVQTPKGEYLAAHRHERGARAAVVLPGVLTTLLRRLSFPKQMHWDARLEDEAGTLPFGRPIRWLVFLHGGRVVPFEILRTEDGASRRVRTVKAGRTTYGHRFFAREGKPGRPVRVSGLEDYQEALASRYVVLDRERRRQRIAQELDRSADAVGGKVALEGGHSTLLDEVPDLVEYPSVVTGTYPAEFLDLPDEVLETTMVHHQHYFPVVDGDGRLTPHFLAVTNTPGDNAAVIARNAERVLVARLRDARFFWDADREVRLEKRLPRLETLLFHKKLGNYREKSDRAATLAARIADEVFAADGETVDAARRAAQLSKADLATDMVGEFPELQGVMGGVYARADGEPETVWRAIYHHYLPIGIEATAPPAPADLGPAAVTWACVSLADKLDTLVGLFQAGERPTGSRDPFGLRRQAQGVIRILVDLSALTGLSTRVSLGQLLALGHAVHGEPDEDTGARLLGFVRERLRYVLEERGFDVRNVRSVTHAAFDELRPLDARRKLDVLPEFTGSSDFRQLATVFKRVKNIARELSDGEAAELARTGAAEARLTEPAETTLLAELQRRRAVIDQAVDRGEGYREAFAEAAAFGPAVDRFFTDIFVMVDDLPLRQARLFLMKQLERTVERLADVSEIVREDEA